MVKLMLRITIKQFYTITFLILISCDDHKFSGGHHSSETLDAQGIIFNSCTNCHSSGGTFPDLSVELCNLVDVQAQQIDMALISIGSPENSYLYHKIASTAGDVNGVPSVMPPSGELSSNEIQTIYDWITVESDCSVDPSSNEPSEEETDPSYGQELFFDLPGEVANSCSGCHGNLETTDFHQLSEKVPERNDEELRDVIVNGLGYMPAFGNDLSEQNIYELIIFLRTTFP